MAFVLCLKKMQVISLTGTTLMMSDKLGPQSVPDAVLPELLARGCVQCDEAGNVLVNGIPLSVAPVAPETEQVEEVDVEELIDTVVAELINGADPSVLGKVDGVPKTFAVSERVGRKVSKLEILASVKRLGY